MYRASGKRCRLVRVGVLSYLLLCSFFFFIPLATVCINQGYLVKRREREKVEMMCVQKQRP